MEYTPHTHHSKCHSKSFKMSLSVFEKEENSLQMLFTLVSQSSEIE